MLLGCIADDFTGASDLANTLAKTGFRTTQFIGVPRKPAARDCEAGVVALKSRSIPAAEAVAQSLAALDWLKAQGAGQFLFKYCSTFDSTPEGNIGPVGEALAEALGARGVAVCPAFPQAGRRVFQGHLFVADKLLSESGMEHHPLNPMTDPDLRRWLRRQSRHPVGHVAWPIVAEGPAAIRAALEASAAKGEWLTVVDAIEDRDLLALGGALEGAALLTGGSGIALGLAANFAKAGRLGRRGSAFQPHGGPAAVLAGSCSGATLGQVAAFKDAHPALAVEVEGLMTGKITVPGALDFMRTHLPEAPLCYSSAPPEAVQRAHARHGRAEVAARVESFFGSLARGLADLGVGRLVVAGGETSGAVVTALGLKAFDIGPEIDPGVPALSTPEGTLAIALKSGNFGGPDFFAKALLTLERGAPENGANRALPDAGSDRQVTI
jgi:3-dehydrotetronate 4-kinase